MVQVSDENSKMLRRIRSGRVTKIPPPSPPVSKDEELRDIGHSMSITNLILGVNSVTVSYLIHCDSLLQNATDIITKCDRSLLQNGTVITKCDVYFKLPQYTAKYFALKG